jgi:hypothetical protein
MSANVRLSSKVISILDKDCDACGSFGLLRQGWCREGPLTGRLAFRAGIAAKESFSAFLLPAYSIPLR